MVFIFALLVLVSSLFMKPGYALRQACIAGSKECANTKVVVVVGGGAAGYFSAIECARLLQEKNIASKVYALEAGRSVLSKVLISGGGRCNVMHNPLKGPNEISKGYPRGSRELLGPLNSRFSPADTYNWFTSRGVTLKTERDGRVFPSTDRSSTIADTLQGAARSADVEVVCGAKVIGVTKAATEETGAKPYKVTFQQGTAGEDGEGGGQVLRSSRSSLYDGLQSDTAAGEGDGKRRREKATVSIECDRVIMATGSSRLGYDIVRGLGHSMLDPLPSLFSFKIQDPALTALSGVSCKHAKLTLLVPKSEGVEAPAGSEKAVVNRPSASNTNSNSKEGLVQRGPLLITRQGVSGPAALKLSAFGARIMSTAKYKFDIEVSWVGDLTALELAQHFTAHKKMYPNRLVSKCFPHLDDDLLHKVRGEFSAGAAGDSNAGSAQHQHEEEDLHLYEVSDTATAVPAAGAVRQPRAVQQVPVDAEDRDNIISKRLWLYLLDRQNITSSSAGQGQGQGQVKWSQMSAQAIQGLAQQLTKGVYSVNGRGQYRDEFVTCGGVSLKEVHFGRMESRVSPGLYLAGEVLDVDGVTGGYNFQSAWTTGYIAGHHCALSLVPPQ